MVYNIDIRLIQDIERMIQMLYEFKVSEKEEKNLQKIWSEVLKNFPEDAEKDMWQSIDRYVSCNGLPETSEHEALTGDELEEYLIHKGLDFEDCRAIIEV